MAFEITGSGSPSLQALDGWGWAQENAETEVKIGWTDGPLAAVTGYGFETSQSKTFPAFSLTASGTRVSYGGTFNVPAFSLSGYGGGAQEDATLNLSATIAGTAIGLGRTVNLNVDIRLPYEPTINFPRFTLTGVGRTEQIGNLSGRIPRFTLSGFGAGNASMDFPAFSVDTVGLAEERGTLEDTNACDFINLFPLCTWSVTASGTHEEQGQLDEAIPAFSLTTNIPASMDIPAFWVDAEAA